jgi:hypothetical protein
LTILAIIENAVIKHELNIMQEVSHFCILILVKFSFDGSKVHRFFHDVEIVRDVEFLGVYWLVENPSVGVFP